MILTKLNGWSNWLLNQRNGRQVVLVGSSPALTRRALWWVACHWCHQHPFLGTNPCSWEDWEGTTAPTTLAGSPHEAARMAAHGDAWGTTLPLHAKLRHKLSLNFPRQIHSHTQVLKGLCGFLKVYLSFPTRRRSKNLYVTLDLVFFASRNPSLPPFHHLHLHAVLNKIIFF